MSFKLTDSFIQQYKGRQPKWGFGDLSYFVYKRTYARTRDDGMQEEFWQTLQRVVEGSFNLQKNHCDNMGLPWNAYKAQNSAQKMFDKMWNFKFLPPGRGLWIMGAPILDKIGSAALQNCGFVSTKDIRKDFGDPFAWAADMLMLGVGIGFDTRGDGSMTIHKPQGVARIVTIEDSREGWVGSVADLINSYAGNGTPVDFDYSEIREAGKPIKGFGGTASGPEPLKDGHERIRALLDQLDEKDITDVAITDIMNIIGKFVVAGNVRRSAEIALGDIESEAFISMKDHDLYPEELRSHRWASNNSVFATADSNFAPIIERIAANGEPGLVFLENARHFGRLKDGFVDSRSSKFDDVLGFNPCAEQQLHNKELCNLVETFPANHDSVEEYFNTLKYAYLYAKSVTLLSTHCRETNQVMLQNRRIGLSMSGIQQAIKKFGSRKFLEGFCDDGYAQVRHWDRIYSRWLGIPTSIRMTTVKPSGTISLLAGATPGVHCTHSEYYLRSFRLAANSTLLPKILQAGYSVELAMTDREKYVKAKSTVKNTPDWHDGLLVENVSEAALEAFASLGGTTVVYFPVKEENFTKSKFDISLWEQLCLVRELQDKWSDNSVSVTVTFKPEEVSDLQSAIEYMAPYVKTLSFLPLQNHNYAQPPYQEISSQEYGDYQSSLRPLRLGRSRDKSLGEKFCSNDVCEVNLNLGT